MLKINMTIEISGKEINLSYDEGRKLFSELFKVYGMKLSEQEEPAACVVKTKKEDIPSTEEGISCDEVDDMFRDAEKIIQNISTKENNSESDEEENNYLDMSIQERIQKMKSVIDNIK